MIAVLLVTLVVACAVAPWLGTDTSDSRSQDARPPAGWFPGVMGR